MTKIVAQMIPIEICMHLEIILNQAKTNVVFGLCCRLRDIRFSNIF